jgi:hypothetical protein
LTLFPENVAGGGQEFAPSEISGRAYNYRLIFSQIWNDMTDARGDNRKGVGDAVLKAQTEEEVIRAFDPWPSYQRDFEPMTSLILRVLRDPDFPKREREAQINFLAGISRKRVD